MAIGLAPEFGFGGHGLSDVHIEELTPEMMPRTGAQVETLKILSEIGSKVSKEERDEIRLIRLELGVPVCLLAEGVLKNVLPLDRTKELADAEPVRRGYVIGDAAKYAARDRAMVEQAKAHGPLTVIVLGGKHRLADPGLEVYRVTTASYPGD